MKTIRILLLICLCSNQIGYAQNTVLKNTHKGNLFYLNGAYKDAIYSYEKVLQESPFNFKANFNLGNAFFKMEEYDKAIEILEPIAKRAKTNGEKSMVYHNIGNCYMMKGEFKEAIEEYKNSLRLNPRDEATRYNLTYALLKQQEKKQQQQKNDQNKDQKEEKNKDQNQNDEGQQNDKDQKQEGNKDQKDDNEKNDDTSQDQKDEPKGNDDKDESDNKEGNIKPKSNELSKEQAKRLLEAAAKKEKEIQEKKDRNLKIGTAKPQAKKDW